MRDTPQMFGDPHGQFARIVALASQALEVSFEAPCGCQL